MKLYVIKDYKKAFPALKGKELTDALIRQCLGIDDAVITRNERGKPFVCCSEKDAGDNRVFISVSHSEDTFALIEAERNVGLDIQYPRSVKADRIAARCFTEDEAAYAANDEWSSSFYKLWTRKEAYCKYTGLGLEQIMKREDVLKRKDVSFRDLRLDDGCFCAICTGTEEGDASDEIQISYREQNL
ncbi:MAG: 4'-phosphopantetheinyl transferase superfamily protein [Firmicutes bacterium]|nr:4'-phosphopantetheinyl transferase superfamily protein [Bacillota bacterium]